MSMDRPCRPSYDTAENRRARFRNQKNNSSSAQQSGTSNLSAEIFNGIPTTLRALKGMCQNLLRHADHSYSFSPVSSIEIFEETNSSSQSCSYTPSGSFIYAKSYTKSTECDTTTDVSDDNLLNTYYTEVMMQEETQKPTQSFRPYDFIHKLIPKTLKSPFYDHAHTEDTDNGSQYDAQTSQHLSSSTVELYQPMETQQPYFIPREQSPGLPSFQPSQSMGVRMQKRPNSMYSMTSGESEKLMSQQESMLRKQQFFGAQGYGSNESINAEETEDPLAFRKNAPLRRPVSIIRSKARAEMIESEKSPIKNSPNVDRKQSLRPRSTINSSEFKKIFPDCSPDNRIIVIVPDHRQIYIDLENEQTHWIHTEEKELPPYWSKTFDKNHGIIYYNVKTMKMQFEHPAETGNSIIDGSVIKF